MLKMATLYTSALVVVIVLSGCSGGGGGGSSPADSPPMQTPGDTTPPMITLNGSSEAIFEQFGVYSDPGATATDNVDGNVSVSVSGRVDTNVIGRYILEYSATDAAGNRASAERTVDVLGATVFPFYEDTADRFILPESYIRSVDTMIYASDAVNAQEYPDARRLVSDIFDDQPVADSVWRSGAGSQGLNVGDPVAYYGLRMLDDITEFSTPTPTNDTLRMTALVVPCADVIRPANPDDLTQEEYVRLDIDPAILEDDFAVLYRVTEIFRQWVKAITNGSEVELVPYVVEDCGFVSYSVGTFDFGGAAIFSYPDTFGILLGVPEEVVSQTDIWWIIAPSGVPGDGSDFREEFVTGGMGTDEFGNALFISDDAWFIRKPAHLGSGPYSEVEQRTYFGQWFQHEYMHHIFREWPEFGLEDSGHQWFDRTTWPNDFQGVYEADYYAEAIDRRLSSATPSLAEGLKRKASDQGAGTSKAGDILPYCNPFHSMGRPAFE